MLYLVTNRKLIKRGTLFSVIEDAIRGGVDAIILREKDLSYDELMPIASRIKKSIEGKGVLLIINSNLKVARDINADGYHVGFHDFIREKPDFKGLLGVSVHSLEEAVLAQELGAKYLVAGHIFETECKKKLEPKGTGFIREIKSHVDIPVIALGGIKPENVKNVFAAGADGIAVMSSIMEASDPYKAATQTSTNKGTGNAFDKSPGL